MNEHTEICDYIPVDFEKYYNDYQPIYDERSKIIQDLADNYSLTVSDKRFQNNLDEFKTNSKHCKKKDAQEQVIRFYASNITFEEVPDEYAGDWKTCQV